MMYVIFGFSVYATALCVDRWRHYTAQKTALEEEWDGLIERLKNRAETSGNPTGRNTPARRIADVAGTGGEISHEEFTDKLRAVFLNETAELEKHLNTISVIATLLPMLGLLGTVVGMVTAFNAISHFGTGDPRIVAEGISQALLTTEAGLIFSIPLIYMHSLLSGRAETIIRMLDEFTTQAAHVCRNNRY